MAALDVWSAILVLLALLTISYPLFRWIARAEGDPWLFKVMYGALAVKMAFALVRYFVIFVVYGGNGDAGVYHEAGINFARRFAAGEPIHPLPVISSFPVETHWIADVTGVVYTVTSPSAYAGFFVFSYLCLLGQILMLRGFKAAVPEGDYRRYALLVLFLPSLLFWPSSIGKEALMLFCLGLVVYGGALLLAPRPKVRGVLIFGLGLGGLSFVRPHIALMSVGALGVAMVVGVLSGSVGQDGARLPSGRGRAIRLVALVAVLLAASFASTRVTDRFSDPDAAGGTSTQSTLAATTAQTQQGGSEFEPIAIMSPTQLPLGIPSVLFRPFPWEAGSVNALIAAVEGLLLLGLFALSWRRIASFPRLAMRRPFLVFASAYVVVFAIGFSFIANFGILARQRTQMLPMVLMLLALPAIDSLRGASSRDADPGNIDPSPPEVVPTLIADNVSRSETLQDGVSGGGSSWRS
jgi:hypothetical protein